MSGLTRVLSAVAIVAVAEAGVSARAAPFYQGPGKCADCHKAEIAVYEQTKHAISFKDIHRQQAVKAIIGAAGGDANMRRNEVCTTCHYTMTQTDASAKPTAAAGPSCESCHGPSSDWLAIHNDFGGPSAKAATESPAHKAERIQKATQAGLIWPSMHYEIATNCLSCHEQARPGISPDTLAKMIEAGHPAGTNFELVQYSQGSIRHRFYPPDVTKNLDMTAAELSQLYVVGQAAALVQAAAVAGKVNNPKYQDTIKKIQTTAQTALDAIKGQVPEAAALLSQPTDANARKLVAAIAGKDLSTQVGGLLPAKNTYK